MKKLKLPSIQGFKCIFITPDLPKGNKKSTKLCTQSKLSIANQEDKKWTNCVEDGVEPLCTSETFCKSIFHALNSLSNQNSSSSPIIDNPSLSLHVLNTQNIENKIVQWWDETWCHNYFGNLAFPNILNSEFLPVGYWIFHKDRANSSGSVIIACRNGITCCDVYFDSSEIVAFTIHW